MRKNYSCDGLSNLDELVPGETFSQIPGTQLAEGWDATVETDTEPVPTLLVEPNTLLREGLRRILTDTRFNVVASCAGFSEVRTYKTSDRPFMLPNPDDFRHSDQSLIGAGCNRPGLDSRFGLIFRRHDQGARWP